MIVRLESMTLAEVQAALTAGNGAIPSTRGSGYFAAAAVHLPTCYAAAVRAGLRHDTATDITRDNGGWLARPSDPSDVEPASVEDARFTLARVVWCNAVREVNRARAA